MQQAQSTDAMRTGLVRAITLPTLNEGEHYAGLILKDDGTPSHHLVLLPGDAEEANWETQTAWAKEAGGELPTRQEQSLLYANCKPHFNKDWYWSCETHSADPAYAWCQGFGYGNQHDDHEHYELRARAVRRLPI